AANCGHEPAARAPVGRGARAARRALGAVRARRAVRPLRPHRVRACAARPPRRAACRGCGAGGFPRALADRCAVRPRAREGEHVDPHARPSPRGRHGSPRAAPPGGLSRACARGRRRRRRRARMAPPAARARAARIAPAARHAARGARACVLRRLQPVGARGEARPAPRYDQEQDVRRPRAHARAARRARDGDVMDVHELTAAYALDALDADEAEAYEAHLAQCESCRVELAELSETAAALAFGVDSPAPPGRLRGAILDAAAAERANVVSLPHRAWGFRVAAAAAAVAACAAVGLGVWGATRPTTKTEA